MAKNSPREKFEGKRGVGPNVLNNVVSLAAVKEEREKMGIQRRGEKWEVSVWRGERYKNGRKKYHREGGFCSEGKAKERENELKLLLPVPGTNAINALIEVEKETTKTLFADVAAEWLAAKKQEIRFKSWKRYREILNLHLNQIFAFAEDEEIISESNIQLAKSYGAKEPRKMKIIDNADQLEKFVNSFRNTCLFLPVLLAAAEGMRESEVIGLRWGDIDLEDGSVDVNKGLHYDAENGGHYEEDPKTIKSARIIEMSTHTILILKAEKERRNPQEDDYVCLNSNAKPFNTKTLSSNFRRASRTKKRGNLKISFKSLRTSFANIMRDLGVEDTAIQEDMGHAHISTTRNHYFKATKKQREQRKKAKESILVNV